MRAVFLPLHYQSGNHSHEPSIVSIYTEGFIEQLSNLHLALIFLVFNVGNAEILSDRVNPRSGKALELLALTLYCHGACLRSGLIFSSHNQIAPKS
ncbi:hypothetical protein [Chamaesiphon sp.]|uniref:hypothetical protein n=1 Tax=Chamaesiphon sp. TaxID=2814140 RepID=UPI003593ACC3